MADYLEDIAIDHLLRNQSHTPTATVYLRLYTDATTDAGGGTEATGGSYAPQAITFAAAASGASTNSNLITFTSMPAGTFTHCSVTDDASGSPNFLFHGPLDASKTTTAGQDLDVGIGDIAVGFTAGSAFTDYARNIVIDRFLRNQSFTPPATVYLATYTDATTRTGGGTESTGGSYARQACALDAASSGATANTDTEDFTNMPSSTITDAAILDASTAGNMMCWGTLNSPVVVPAADTFRIAAGDLTFTVD